MVEHHATRSPSKFPMFEKCACFENAPVGEAAQRGTLQHEAAQEILTDAKDRPAWLQLTIEEQEQVSWYVTEVRNRTGDHRMVEERISLYDGFDEITFGTADVADRRGARAILIDYKSGEERDYRSQMAVYARALMLKFGVNICDVFELYGRYRRVVKYALTLTGTEFVLDIARAVDDPNKEPRACDYCGWCAKQGTCPAVGNAIQKVAVEYAGPEMEIQNWHSSQVTDPQQMAKMLEVAKVVEDWAGSVKKHAKDLALSGVDVPGHEIKREARKSFGEDFNAAQIFGASKLDQQTFMSVCKVGMTDLRRAVAQSIGMKTAAGKKAKDEFNARFGALLVDSEVVKFQKKRSK